MSRSRFRWERPWNIPTAMRAAIASGASETCCSLARDSWPTIKNRDSGGLGRRRCLRSCFSRLSAAATYCCARRAAKKIFERFYRLDNAVTRETGGNGLGFSIARRLARGMGGDLVFRPREGGGSVFEFVLPAAPAPVAKEGENTLNS